MLELDADQRINAEEALAHAYLAQYADPSDEPTSPAYDQSFEDMDLSVEEWKGIYLLHSIQKCIRVIPLISELFCRLKKTKNKIMCVTD